MTFLDPNTINTEEEMNSTLALLDEYYKDQNGQPTDEEGNPISPDTGEEQLGVGQPEEIPGENGDEGDDGVRPEGDNPDDEPQGTPQSVSVNGKEFSLSDITRYAEFERFLTEHPDVAARVVEAARGPGGPPATVTSEPPAAPTPPPELDLEDPAIKFLWEQHISTQEQLRQLQKTQYEARVAQAEAQLQRAESIVKDKFQLSEPDIAKLRDVTASLNIIPGFISRNQSNPVNGFAEALEYTYWATPEFRERFIQTKVDEKVSTAKDDKTRQAKLNKLSNSSGGGRAPARQVKDPKQMTESERREAMIKDISEVMYN